MDLSANKVKAAVLCDAGILDRFNENLKKIFIISSLNCTLILMTFPVELFLLSLTYLNRILEHS